MNVIMPAGSTQIDLNTLLAVLSDPKTTKDAIAQLAKSTSESSKVLSEVKKQQEALELARKAHEADMSSREQSLAVARDNIDSKFEDILRREAAVKHKENEIYDREVNVAHKERETNELMVKQQERAHTLDIREEALKDTQYTASVLADDTAKLRKDYEDRITKLKALAG